MKRLWVVSVLLLAIIASGSFALVHLQSVTKQMEASLEEMAAEIDRVTGGPGRANTMEQDEGGLGNADSKKDEKSGGKEEGQSAGGQEAGGQKSGETSAGGQSAGSADAPGQESAHEDVSASRDVSAPEYESAPRQKSAPRKESAPTEESAPGQEGTSQSGGGEEGPGGKETTPREESRLAQMAADFQTQWEKDEAILIRYIHHDELDTITGTVARLQALAKYDSIPELAAEIDRLRHLVRHIYESQIPFPRNVF